MSRPGQGPGRIGPLDEQLDDQRRAEEDAAATILAMLTSGAVDADVVHDADGEPLSAATRTRRSMWF